MAIGRALQIHGGTERRRTSASGPASSAVHCTHVVGGLASARLCVPLMAQIQPLGPRGATSPVLRPYSDALCFPRLHVLSRSPIASGSTTVFRQIDWPVCSTVDVDGRQSVQAFRTQDQKPESACPTGRHIFRDFIGITFNRFSRMRIWRVPREGLSSSKHNFSFNRNGTRRRKSLQTKRRPEPRLVPLETTTSRGQSVALQNQASASGNST